MVKVFEIKTATELLAASLPAPPSLSAIDADGWVHVYWGGYDYAFDLADIDSPALLLGWVVHLADKGWEQTTPYRIQRFIEKVARVKGWDIWNLPQSSPGAERAKLTPSLRWRVLARDNFTCQGCGASPKTGDVVLHVDHIIAVVNGGKTVENNLQVLCLDCNLGKGCA